MEGEKEEGEIIRLGRVSVYNEVYHNQGFKRNKLKDIQRGEGKGSDLCDCDEDGNISGSDLNIFQKAQEKTENDETFPQRLFTPESYQLYLRWVKKQGPKVDYSQVIHEQFKDKVITPQKGKDKKRKDVWKCAACGQVLGPIFDSYPDRCPNKKCLQKLKE